MRRLPCPERRVEVKPYGTMGAGGPVVTNYSVAPPLGCRIDARRQRRIVADRRVVERPNWEVTGRYGFNLSDVLSLHVYVESKVHRDYGVLREPTPHEIPVLIPYAAQCDRSRRTAAEHPTDAVAAVISAA